MGAGSGRGEFGKRRDGGVEGHMGTGSAYVSNGTGPAEGMQKAIRRDLAEAGEESSDYSCFLIFENGRWRE